MNRRVFQNDIAEPCRRWEVGKGVLGLRIWRRGGRSIGQLMGKGEEGISVGSLFLQGTVFASRGLFLFRAFDYICFLNQAERFDRVLRRSG